MGNRNPRHRVEGRRKSSYRNPHNNFARQEEGGWHQVKHQVWCPKANRKKVKFETEAKALHSLQFLDDQDFKEGKKPIRAYYCVGCLGWHITSAPPRENQVGTY